MSTRRLATTAGAAGLIAGVALGATGLASAAGSSPTPTPATGAKPAAPSGGPQGRHPGRPGGPGGPGMQEAVVVSVTSSTLEVATPRGTRTISLTDKTKYFQGPDSSNFATLGKNELVRVQLVDRSAAKPVAAEVHVLPAHLEGYVTAVTGGTLTVLDQGGFSRTVLTSLATKVQKDGASGKLTDIAVGSFVRASGTAQGSDLQAAHLATGRPAKGERPGPGGPGGRANDAPPADAPSADAPPADAPAA